MLNRSLLLLLVIILLGTTAGLSQEDAAVGDRAVVQETSGSVLLSTIQMWEGRQALSAGRTEEATEHFLRASGYMRSDPRPHFALARIYLRTSSMDAFLELATALKLLLTDFVYQSLLVANLAVIVLIALGLTLYSAAAIIIFRYVPTIWHSLIISLSPLVKGLYLKAILVGGIASFFIVLSGRSLTGMVTWALVIGVALSWKFAVSAERRVLAALVVFLILFGPLLNACNKVLSTQRPDSPVRLAAMVDRIDEDALIDRLDHGTTDSRFDPINEFMRGLLALKKGNNIAAIERFNIASKFAPHDAAILNNMGVALHRLGRYREAISAFRQALRYAPREALVHYNYAQTLNAVLQYDLSQDELAKASTLDFDLIRSLVTRKDTGFLVPMNLQTRILWKLALDSDVAATGLSYNPVESGTAGVLFLVLISGALLAFMRRAKVPARCDICGKTLPSQIARRRGKEFLCTECHRIKENGTTDQDVEDDLENRLKKKEIREILTRIVLGLVVPGSVYHLSGRRNRGLVLAFVLFTLVLLVASGDTLVKPIPDLGTSPVAGWSVPFFVVVYALYCWRSTALAIRGTQEGRG